MSTEPIVNGPIETPVVTEPVAEVPPTPEVPETPELVYEYQPVDELGRKLGNKQVFKGKTWEIVLEKVAKAHQEAIKLNRELNKKNRLGYVEVEDIPEDVVRFSTEESFSSHPLSEEEKYQISRDLLDPEKFDEAADRLFEAKIGAKPDKITKALSKAQDDIADLRAQREAELFVSTTPEYYGCKENFETITSWMVKNGLAPVSRNFKYAFEQLSAVGLLLEAPIVREEIPVEPVTTPVTPLETPANSQPEPEPVSRITDSEPQSQSKRTARVASGFTRESVPDTGGITQSKPTLTVAEIERMPSDVYGKRLRNDPQFAKAVDEAYAKAGKRG